MKAARAEELWRILNELEAQLANPVDATTVGSAYRKLSSWTWEHQWDDDLGEVLDLLTPEDKYPAWRRQALEEAYMLFYEDVAKQGDRAALERLPEPPTSEDVGYRALPEALVSRNAAQGLLFSHSYEDGHACCFRRRWDYDIRRTGPALRKSASRTTSIDSAAAGGANSSGGRQIIAKGKVERCCTCATDPINRWLTPADFCCSGRNGKSLFSMLSGGSGHASAPKSPEKYRPIAPTANWPRNAGPPGIEKATTFPPPRTGTPEKILPKPKQQVQRPSSSRNSLNPSNPLDPLNSLGSRPVQSASV